VFLTLISQLLTLSIRNVEAQTDYTTMRKVLFISVIASDILKTVVDPTLDELAILGGVVVVRTVLSVFLNKEIKELAEIYKWFILKKSVISDITPKVSCGKLYCITSTL